MNILTQRSVFVLYPLTTLAVMGQTTSMPMEMTATPMQSSISFSYRSAFNIKSSFEHVGRIGLSNPGPATRATDHFYDDGYNRVDSTGNDHFGDQSTTFWGYQNDSQYDSSGTGSIAMHSASAPGGSSKNTDDPQSGAELAYSRELMRGDHWHGGFEGAFDYQHVYVKNSGTFHSTVTHVTDVY